MTNNWIELNLTKDEERLVREAAELYKATYINTIDSVFTIARGIETLRARHYGMGKQGGFGDALVQYGFTARDGETPIDKGIRSNLKELLDNEKEVRAWWGQTPERKKRDWVSARAIYRHWKRSQDKPAPDPHAPPRRNPVQELKATTIELQKQLATALKREPDVRERFEPSGPVNDIAQALFGMFHAYPNNKGEKIAKQWLELITAKKQKKAGAATAKPSKPKGTPEEAGSFNKQGVFIPVAPATKKAD
jgi:hypothetical protein